MKHAALVLLLSIAWTMPSRSSDDVLTVEELARHLGVLSWASEVYLRDGTFDLLIFRVVDGKIAEESLLSLTARSTDFPTERESTRVAILASPTQGGTHLSIQLAGGLSVSHIAAFITLTETSGGFGIFPLPAILTAGDYVLGGGGAAPGKNIQSDPAKMKDLKECLLLRVTKRP